MSLMPLGEAVGGLLKARKETAAVAESSTGGLIAASLLAVPGASAYFVGGGVIYTHKVREALLGIELADHPGLRASAEPYALLCATTMRAPGHGLGHRRERGDGPDRQPLRRCRRP